MEGVEWVEWVEGVKGVEWVKGVVTHLSLVHCQYWLLHRIVS